jgi:succinate-semialdehyde dehydrogenase / glutarate-semialdehyde dehydrogenase
MTDIAAFNADGRMVIGDRLVGGDGLTVREVDNPADGSIVGTIPVADEALVDEAVRAAEAAFPTWAKTPAFERARHLRALAGWLREHTEQIARLLTLEQGKPTSEARSEVGAAAASFDYYAEEAIRIYGETIPTASASLRSTVLRQPVGVVAAIAAWNYPLGLMSWKVAPALAAGCTVVAKPSEQTPFNTLALVEGARAVGLPPGVLNVVTGGGRTVGNALAGHPRVDLITFTGGTGTGKQLMHLAADGIKRVALELGGHSPMIIAADAPVELAVKDGVKRAFRNAGQLCNSVNRIYVEQPLLQEFTERYVAETAKLTVGFGTDDPEPGMGPLTVAEGVEHVEKHVADAVERGGEVLIGGSRPDGARFERGHFYLPTVIGNAGDDMLMTCEETFGPVAPIAGIADVEEGIARSNSLDYGLVAYLYTRDLKTAALGSEALEFGTVNVNNVGGGDVPFPYAGWKHSGIGTELGRDGIEAFLLAKHVRVELGY